MLVFRWTDRLTKNGGKLRMICIFSKSIMLFLSIFDLILSFITGKPFLKVTARL